MFPRGFDLSPDGILYGIFPSSLRTIDPATGSSTFVANCCTVGFEAIAFSNDGTLYAVGGGPVSLYTLSRSTGQLTLIGALEGVVDIDALTFAGGFLYGADPRSDHDADLFRIDPATTGVLNLAKTGVTGLNRLAAAPAVVPLPSDFPLFGTGLGILGFLGWRRRRKVTEAA